MQYTQFKKKHYERTIIFDYTNIIFINLNTFNTMKQKETFTREITYKMKNGKMINTIKRFRSLHHFDNYYNKLVQAQCNVLDITNPVQDFYRNVNSIFNYEQ